MQVCGVRWSKVQELQWSQGLDTCQENFAAPSGTRKGDGCRNNPLTCQDKELSLTYAREVAYI